MLLSGALFGFSFTGLVEVHPWGAVGGVLHQDRIGRAEAPLIPVGEHLVLDGLRPGPPEGQDMRLGFLYVLFRTEAAVETYSRAALDLLSLDANPTEIVFIGMVGLGPDAEEW